jgi:membrane fusion protein (multidrug efflux system)
MVKKTKIILLVVLIFAALFILRLLNLKSAPRVSFGSGKTMMQKVTVKVMPARKEDLSLVLSYVGSIKAKDEINVYSKITGKLVQYIVNEGDNIQKGDTIALIDRDETGLKYELAKVESPLSGIVGRTLLDKGANVLPSSGIVGGTTLAIIVNMDQMVVKLNIPELDIPYLKNGLKAVIKVDAYPQDNFLGEVSKVSEVVDPQTRTLPIEVTIPNQDHRLKSGMFCRIKINVAELKNRLVLLQDALVQEQGANYIFVVQDHIAKKRKITLGVKEDSKIEVLEGLQEGENVIIFGQQGLKDGTEVEIEKD